MSIALIQHNFSEAQQLLALFVSNEDNLKQIENAAQLMLASLKREGKILACGNGGSMCDAMHFAEELTGRFREDRRAIPAIAIADASHLSCVGNDYGYAEVFARYIAAVGRKEDVVMLISTSGNSENIVNAAKAAKKKGMKVVGLTGNEGGKLAQLCDVEIRVPHHGYADRIQEVHIKIIHSLIHYIEENLD